MSGGITYFDITDVLLYLEHETTVSGIQRVSFEVIPRVIKELGEKNVRLSYWDRSKRAYLCIDLTAFSNGEKFTPTGLQRVFFGKTSMADEQIAPTLRKYVNKPMKYKFHHMMRRYHARKGNDAYFRRRGASLRDWTEFHERQAGTAEPKLYTSAHLHPVELKDRVADGDRLVILGAIWNIPGIYDAFQELRDKRGLEISQLVHDLVPIMRTEHLADNFSSAFYYWLERTLGYCSKIYANSESTARDMRAFMDEVGVHRPVGVVPLAQRFSDLSNNGQSNSDGTIAARIKEQEQIDLPILNLIKHPYMLVVGTMESRKNGWRLAQAWKRLSEDRDIEVPKLVFAGKTGWHNKDFDQFMQSTGQLSGWIQVVEKPSDAELRFLYRHCLFTGMVSFYEGWGLPIGEGLSFGKTGVVANNSSMPEVGGDMVEYCDAQSISSIYDACRKLIVDVEHRASLEARIASTRLRTWDDVATDLKAQF